MNKPIFSSQSIPILQTLLKRFFFRLSLAPRNLFLMAAAPIHYVLSLLLAAGAVVFVFFSLAQAFGGPASPISAQPPPIGSQSFLLLAAILVVFSLVDGWRNRAFLAQCEPLSLRRPLGSMAVIFSLGLFVWVERIERLRRDLDGQSSPSTPSAWEPAPLWGASQAFRPSRTFAPSQRAATWRDCFAPLKFSFIKISAYLAVLAQTSMGLIWASASAAAMAALLLPALAERGVFVLISTIKKNSAGGASNGLATRIRLSLGSWLAGVAAEASENAAGKAGK